MKAKTTSKDDTKSLKGALKSLSVAEKSCREEADSEPVATSTAPNAMSGDRADGINCIADQIADIRAFLIGKHMVALTKKQVAALRELAGNAERDDLVAALE